MRGGCAWYPVHTQLRIPSVGLGHPAGIHAKEHPGRPPSPLALDIQEGGVTTKEGGGKGVPQLFRRTVAHPGKPEGPAPSPM